MPPLHPFLDQSLSSDSAAYTQALHKLVTSCYLKPSTVLSHISPRDKRISYEAEEKAKINGFPTAKELRQAREVAEGRLKREEDEAEKVGMVGRHSCTIYGGDDELTWSIVSQKRKSQVSSRPSKASGSFTSHS
jgi:hypothetical protein